MYSLEIVSVDIHVSVKLQSFFESLEASVRVRVSVLTGCKLGAYRQLNFTIDNTTLLRGAWSVQICELASVLIIT